MVVRGEENSDDEKKVGRVTQQYSVIGILLEASVVVQLVMVALVIISVMSWAVIFGRRRAYSTASVAMTDFEGRFWSGMDLARLYLQTNSSPNEDSGQENVFRAGFKEFNRLCQTKGTDADSIVDGAARAMRVALMRERDKLELHLWKMYQH